MERTMRNVLTVLMLCLLAAGLAGCQRNTELDHYLASVEAKSNEIKASLAQDELTQTDLNLKSGELYELWDGAMHRMLEEAKRVLPAAKMENLTAEQNIWLENRARAAENASKEFEGGSMYALVLNSELAELTEARVYELDALLQ